MSIDKPEHATARERPFGALSDTMLDQVVIAVDVAADDCVLDYNDLVMDGHSLIESVADELRARGRDVHVRTNEYHLGPQAPDDWLAFHGYLKR